jgi:hypothetical protein
MIKLISLSCLCTMVFACTGLHAQNYADTINNPGIYAIPVAAPFLRFNQDVRSSGMGNTAVALPGDDLNHYANPARMMNVTSKAGATAAYSSWLHGLSNNIYHLSFSGYARLNDEEVISGGFRYFKQGSLTHTDENGQAVGSSEPYDWCFDAAYSRKLAEHWNIGGTMRFIQSHMLNGNDGYAGYKNGNSVAADIGVYYSTAANSKNQSWHFGTAITNLGSKMSYGSDDKRYYLPANFSLGAAFETNIEETHHLTFSAELNKLLVPSVDATGVQPDKGVIGAAFSSWRDAPGGFSEEVKEMIYGFGVEYTYKTILSLRSGYYHESTAKGGLQYATFGLGLHYKDFILNMAYLAPTGGTASANTISNTFKIGFTCHFKKS